MKKILLGLLLLSSALFAELKNEFINQKLIDSGIQIVDIRTEGEWKETGIVRKSIPIMFFDDRGGYNVAEFMKKLQTKVDTSREFALICHTGSRTRLVSEFLSKEYGYKVINLSGGIDYAKRKGIKLVPYSK